MDNAVLIAYNPTLQHKRAYPVHINLPSSKSISNRVLALQHLYFPELNLINLSKANDTLVMQNALTCLKQNKLIDIEDAGTVARFITALASITSAKHQLKGTDRMSKRPMHELIEVLRSMQVNINCLEQEGFLPLDIMGKPLQGGNFSLSIEKSSQFLSALIMIAPTFKNKTTFHLKGPRNSWSYALMTIKLMQQFGFKISYSDSHIEVDPFIPELKTPNYTIENDWSAAAFFLEILSLLTPKSSILFDSLLPENDSLQGDSILQTWCPFFGLNNSKTQGGMLFTHEAFFEESILDFSNNPDLALPYIVAKVMQKQKFMLNGTSTLQYKESDRMICLLKELDKCGVTYNIMDKAYVIDASTFAVPRHAVFETYHDHRIAMSLAPLAKFNTIYIKNPLVVNKSYPNYWEELLKLNFELQFS